VRWLPQAAARVPGAEKCSALRRSPNSAACSISPPAKDDLLGQFDIPILLVTTMAAASSDLPALNKPRHVKYWLRCLKTFLPGPYLSMDSNRTLIAAFTVSALDLLSGLDGAISAEERTGYVDWLYSCQVPSGGFRGSPSHSLQDQWNEQNAAWDPANVPATSFALTTLILLGDDLSRVKRKECLEWIRQLQRPDGSFGEILGENGAMVGKSDPRLAYCAVMIRWFLGGGLEGDVEDIRVDDLVRWLQTLEVSIATGQFLEHGSFSYQADL
jgi:geranylgeranyl transferase type-1 subunit beta